MRVESHGQNKCNNVGNSRRLTRGSHNIIAHVGNLSPARIANIQRRTADEKNLTPDQSNSNPVPQSPGEPNIALRFKEFSGVPESATYIADSVAPVKKLWWLYGVLDVIIFQHSALVLKWKFVFHPGCVFQLTSCIVLILHVPSTHLQALQLANV